MVTRLKMRRIAIYEQQVIFTNIKNNIHSYSKCHSHPFCQSGTWSTDWNALHSLNSASRALDKERLTCHTKYKIHFTKHVHKSGTYWLHRFKLFLYYIYPSLLYPGQIVSWALVSLDQCNMHGQIILSDSVDYPDIQ